MAAVEATLRRSIFAYITGEKRRGSATSMVPRNVLAGVEAVMETLLQLRQDYQASNAQPLEHSEEAWSEKGIMHLESTWDLSSNCPSELQPSQQVSTTRQASPKTPGTAELVALLQQDPTSPGNTQQVDRNLQPSIMKMLQPQDFALPDTPVLSFRANFEAYNIYQLRQSMKQLGKQYLSRDQAILNLRKEFNTRGWLPNIHFTQFQIMSPGRRQTLEETITDWIKDSPWYLLILTFVPVNKQEMHEHMKMCHLNISLETLNSYLLSQNVLMAEGEKKDTTGIEAEKLEIKYPRQNGEKQLTLKEVIQGGDKKHRKQIKRKKD